jgi:hypothetical protein
MPTSKKISEALQGLAPVWSRPGLLWLGMVASLLFLVASCVAMTSSIKYEVSDAVAAELVAVGKGTKETVQDSSGTSKTMFTPAMNGTAAVMVVVSIILFLLSLLASVGYYVSKEK